MRQITMTLLIAVWASNAWAQSPYVYLVKAAGCPGSPKPRTLTGFRIEDPEKRGIITALHGVVGCTSLSARTWNSEVFADLALVAADTEGDAALLSNAMLSSQKPEGLRPAQDVDWDKLKEVVVVGHPFGTGKSGDHLLFRIPPIGPLEQEAPSQVSLKLRARSSPSTKLRVLRLQGPLVPGDSGAPIVDAKGLVLAVANGGLYGGTAGLGWAIPYNEIRLTSLSSNPRLKELERLDAEGLFKFDPYEEPSIGPSKAEIEKDLRRIFDGVGEIYWEATGDKRFWEGRKFAKLEGCNLHLRSYYTLQFPTGKEYRIDHDYSIDLSDVSFAINRCCDVPEAQPKYFPKGRDILTIASAPGFKTVRYENLVHSVDGSERTYVGQMGALNLYYDQPNALNTALRVLQTAKEQCSAAR